MVMIFFLKFYDGVYFLHLLFTSFYRRLKEVAESSVPKSDKSHYSTILTRVDWLSMNV